MEKNKMTWSEMAEYLRHHHNEKGVVVFKQHPKWNKEYSEGERSYVVSGDNKHFYDNMISTSIWADALEGTDKGVRLDWYMFYEEPEYKWQVDYCYLLNK